MNFKITTKLLIQTYWLDDSKNIMNGGLFALPDDLVCFVVKVTIGAFEIKVNPSNAEEREKNIA